MTTQINLVNGPSKFDLMAALFVWKPNRNWVKFQADDGSTYEALINACEAEDGSGECWIIRGVAHNNTQGGRANKHFKGFFRTNTRKGHLAFIE